MRFENIVSVIRMAFNVGDASILQSEDATRMTIRVADAYKNQDEPERFGQNVVNAFQDFWSWRTLGSCDVVVMTKDFSEREVLIETVSENRATKEQRSGVIRITPNEFRYLRYLGCARGEMGRTLAEKTLRGRFEENIDQFLRDWIYPIYSGEGRMTRTALAYLGGHALLIQETEESVEIIDRKGGDTLFRVEFRNGQILTHDRFCSNNEQKYEDVICPLV